MQYITNPQSMRPVKVGSATYNRLVRTGVLHVGSLGFIDKTNPINPQKSKFEVEIAEEATTEDIEAAKGELDVQLEPQMKHAVRGRGKNKGKLVPREKVPTVPQVAEATLSLRKKAKKADHVLSTLEQRIARELGLCDDNGEGWESDESE